MTTYSNIGGRAISADAWGISNENASVQYVRTDTRGAAEAGLTGEYYGNFTKITTTGKFVVVQVIPTADSDALRGATVRVQLWMKGIVAASQVVRVGLIDIVNVTNDSIPNNAGNFISAFGANGTDPTFAGAVTSATYLTPSSPDNAVVSGNAISCTVTNAWQRYGATFVVPTDCTNLLVMLWTNSQLAATNGIAVSQATLTLDVGVLNWVPRPVTQEFLRVQAFYVKSFDRDTGPAQNAGTFGGVVGWVNVAGATAGQIFGVRFPVSLYKAAGAPAPTTTFYNPSAANAFVRNQQLGTNATATAVLGLTQGGMQVQFTGIAAWAVGQPVTVNFTVDAEL